VLVLDGYRELVPVGRGGHSEVYRGYQEKFDRWVAIKILAVALTDERSQRRFLRECQLAGRLSAHPNIVTLYDAGIAADGRPYITMELFPDGSIRDLLDNGGPLPVEDAVQIGIALAGALETAHRAGVIHRDITPANALLTPYGQPVLADFGLSVLAERHEVSIKTDGFTPYYAAPEVIERTATTPASDVYSLAATLYAVLAGHAAHEVATGDSLPALLLRILQTDVPPLTRPDVPATLVRTLAAAMARDPAHRTSTALAFATDLERAQAELGVTPTHPVVLDLEAAGVDVASPPAPPMTSGAPEFVGAAPEGHLTVERVRPPAAVSNNGGGTAVSSLPPAVFGPPPPGELTIQRDGQPRRPPPMVIPTDPAGPRRRPGRRALALGGLLLVAVAAAVVGLGLRDRVSDDDHAGGDGSDSSPGSEPDDAAIPTGLHVVESPAGVELSWEGDTAGSYLVLVLSESDEPQVVPAENGPSLLIPETSLRPGVGYCYAVALVATVDAMPSGDVASVFSPPQCIRGANQDTVQGAATPAPG